MLKCNQVWLVLWGVLRWLQWCRAVYCEDNLLRYLTLVDFGLITVFKFSGGQCCAPKIWWPWCTKFSASVIAKDDHQNYWCNCTTMPDISNIMYIFSRWAVVPKFWCGGSGNALGSMMDFSSQAQVLKCCTYFSATCSLTGLLCTYSSQRIFPKYGSIKGLLICSYPFGFINTFGKNNFCNPLPTLIWIACYGIKKAMQVMSWH